jgi:hypothetical protein
MKNHNVHHSDKGNRAVDTVTPYGPTERARANESGFTIVEVVIASLLLIIGIVALFGASIAAVKTQHMSTGLYHATCLARNRVQRGLSLPFDTLPALADTYETVDQYGNSTGNGEFRRTTTLTAVSPNCYEITVDVYYPDGRGGFSAIPATIQSKIARSMHTEEIEE